MKTLSMASAMALDPRGQLRQYAYNALDVTGTLEIYNTLKDRLTPADERIYALERAMQGPAMSMTLRGIKVDTDARTRVLRDLEKEVASLEKSTGTHPAILAVWDKLIKVTGACPTPSRKDGKHKWQPKVPDTPERHCMDCGASRFEVDVFNPGSADQVKHLMYDLLGMKKQTGKNGEVTVNDEALDKLAAKYPAHGEIIRQIRTYRDARKQAGDVGAKLTPDNRFKSVFNVGAAWTGRWSSSKDPFGYGRNLQNVAERHRYMFVADPGWEMIYADLKQAESNVVAHMAADEKYIEAHKLGDVHTYVTRLVWPDMPWTGDLKEDKKIAKQLPPWDPVEGHDYRFQSKRIQHGSNYGLTPFGVSMIAHIPLREAQSAQRNYFRAFPGIPAWHDRVAEQVRNGEPLVNPLGRTIRLFGRPWDKRTWRQGLAFLPSSTVADIINIGIYLVWRELEATSDPLERKVQLLAQVHDAMLAQFRRGETSVAHRIMELMRVPVPIVGIDGITRMAEIETEAAVGLNWGHRSTDNPDGIQEI